MALGLVGWGAALPAAAAQATVQLKPASPADRDAQRFFQVALGRGDQTPRGKALEVLREYVRTDFGKEMIGKVLADFDRAAAQGWVTPAGELTESGEFAGFVPFRIVHDDRTASAGLREVRLPERFGTHFSGSGLRIFPLAIVHHEFGHTQFGRPPRSEDVVTDEYGSRLSVNHELDIVKAFENPVRERYGYAPRTSYENHLGERAGQP